MALAVVLVLSVATSPLFTADAWTLWRGTTTFTDINAPLPTEAQVEVEKGLA